MKDAEWANAIKERDGWCCTECGSTEGLHAHHIKPVILGGKNTLDNGRTLCTACHGNKHSGKNSGKYLWLQNYLNSELTRKEAARALDTSTAEVRSLQAQGKLPGFLTYEAVQKEIDRRRWAIIQQLEKLMGDRAPAYFTEHGIEYPALD